MEFERISRGGPIQFYQSIAPPNIKQFFGPRIIEYSGGASFNIRGTGLGLKTKEVLVFILSYAKP